jgi:hypothetical protein
MKKQYLVLTILIMFLSFGMNAQNKSKAKEISEEMTEVLSLNKKETKAIYKIQLNRLNESDSIKKEYANDPEEKKQNLKKLGKKVYNEIKEAIGIERLKEWKEYKSK